MNSLDLSEVPDLDLRGIIQHSVNIIEFVGYFTPEFKNYRSKICYLIYSLLIVTISLILFMLSELINVILLFGDIEKMSTASFLLITHIIELGKVFVLYKYSKRIRQLINSLNREIFKPKNLKQYNIWMNYTKVSRLIVNAYLSLCLAVCVLWSIFPLIENDVDGIHLPLGGWFPFDTNESPIFEIIFAYQIGGTVITGISNIGTDTLMSGLMMAVAGQLTLLNDSIENLGKERQNERDILIDLQIIIEHHRNIIEFSNEAQFLFTNCILGQFAASVIIVCVTLFQMALLPVMSIRFFSMALYQGCVLYELFLPCYFGNEVKLESMKLTDSAFKCQWIDANHEFKKNLLFFMTRSQIPLELYAGGYFILSLETFVAILKTSWSYFAVLNSINEE